MKLSKMLFGVFALALFAFACEDDNDNTPDKNTFTFEFTTATEGWVGAFADLPKLNNQQDSSIYELSYKWAALPAEVGGNRVGALQIIGHNRSDDLFMFVKRKVAGLLPNTTYQVDFDIDLASEAPTGAVGIGGAPGESVYFKAGVSNKEPLAVLDPQDNHYRMNIDKGQQSESGREMKVLGDIANGKPANGLGSAPFTIIKRKATAPISVKTDAQGACWIVLGTDSGFEGLTRLYYDRVGVVFTPQAK
ncbi:MAG TPA: hypothetical protein PLC89_17260 [Haliscomenobacter sp.]|uniref:hypothetical protein n=1 Tax=Haliscomenobacter sp. TaxID=2717303 RepID=UPI002C388E79|nr:hypothetical protein [Haliscomenobacter sp.]HOY19058.1 hypothetical protein [Haliscomenobacter sp.]HPH19714.1 hypothetical protein [Haliscomenobacter sp.]